jgi:hypothetical protein
LNFNRNDSNIKPVIIFAMDALLAVFSGITISISIVAYACPAGGFAG